jgi:fructokinase
VQPDRDIWRDRLVQLLPLARLVKISEEDFGLLWPSADPVALARSWLSHDAESGPALVVLTRGARGAVALTRQLQLEVPALAVTVDDTVGAGDAFQAALIDGLLCAKATTRTSLGAMDAPALTTLLTRCNRAAAYTCQRRGAVLPHALDLDHN